MKKRKHTYTTPFHAVWDTITGFGVQLRHLDILRNMHIGQKMLNLRTTPTPAALMPLASRGWRFFFNDCLLFSLTGGEMSCACISTINRTAFKQLTAASASAGMFCSRARYGFLFTREASLCHILPRVASKSRLSLFHFTSSTYM